MTGASVSRVTQKAVSCTNRRCRRIPVQNPLYPDPPLSCPAPRTIPEPRPAGGTDRCPETPAAAPLQQVFAALTTPRTAQHEQPTPQTPNVSPVVG
jgi:hypothetical protein